MSENGDPPPMTGLARAGAIVFAILAIGALVSGLQFGGVWWLIFGVDLVLALGSLTVYLRLQR